MESNSSPARPSLLSVRLFGSFCVEFDGQPIRRFRTTSSAKILALLVTRRGVSTARSHIAEMIWPTSTPQAALANLRRSLTDIRRVLSEFKGAIRKSGVGSLALDISFFNVDLWEVDPGVRDTDPEIVLRAAKKGARPFLAGWDDEWVLEERRRIEELLSQRLEETARTLISANAEKAAVRLLTECLSRDPLREDIVLLQMEAMTRSGDHDGALQCFRAFRVKLREAMGAEPESETLKRYREIRSSTLSAIPNIGRTHQGHVPVAQGPLVGRHETMQGVAEALDRARVVTLVGPGGIGKTQTAIHIAHALGGRFQDGIWYVELASVDDAEGIVNEIALRLNADLDGVVSDIALITELEERNLLLILDNCEQIAKACAGLVRKLTQYCPNLRILATSRKPLGLTTEVSWKIGPLETPPDLVGHRPAPKSLADINSFPAVDMFIAEAIRANPQLHIKDSDVLSISSICRKAGGNPLNLQLAARWVRKYTFEQLDGLLDEPLRILEPDGATGSSRQGSAVAVLDASWALLADDERVLLSELSIFRGGWQLSAMEAVCSSSTRDRPIVWLINQLVENSLVQANLDDPTPRYSLHEVVRHYAQRKLDRPASRQLQQRYVEAIRQWVYAHAPSLKGGQQHEWLRCFIRERFNIDHALSIAKYAKFREAGLRIAGEGWRFWFLRGDYRAGLDWLTGFLSMSPKHKDTYRLTAVGAAGNMAYRLADYNYARELFLEHLALSRELESPSTAASALGGLANVAMDEGKHKEALERFSECIAAFSSLGNERGVALTHANLAIVHTNLGEFEEAQCNHSKSMEMFKAANDLHNVAVGLINFADIWHTAGRFVDARRYMLEALVTGRKVSDKRCEARCLTLAAQMAVRSGNFRVAAKVVGAARSALTHSGSAVPAQLRHRLEDVVANIRDNLEVSIVELEMDSGSSLTAEEIEAQLMEIAAAES
nr:hypothetical protein Hi04_10k_c2089_00014 [uncultured bacterium]